MHMFLCDCLGVCVLKTLSWDFNDKYAFPCVYIDTYVTLCVSMYMCVGNCLLGYIDGPMCLCVFLHLCIIVCVCIYVNS